MVSICPPNPFALENIIVFFMGFLNEVGEKIMVFILKKYFNIVENINKWHRTIDYFCVYGCFDYYYYCYYY